MAAMMKHERHKRYVLNINVQDGDNASCYSVKVRSYVGDDIPAVAGVPSGAAVDPKYEDVGGETTLVITLSLGTFIIQRSTSLETERGNSP